MPLAFISDVHGNLEALEAVLRDIDGRKIKNIYFLGDAVGYGPNPNECTRLVKDRSKALMAGNHDWAVLGITAIEYFNENAKAAIRWTDDVLKEEIRDMLRTFSMVKALKKEDMFLVHSTPKDPEEWHYLLTLYDAEVNFNYFDQKICLLGHSHFPFIIEKLPSQEMLIFKDEAMLMETGRYIINAGSVGQPRDGDPRACYALIEGKKARFIRVGYDIKKTQRKMHEAGLPMPLIERLERGL